MGWEAFAQGDYSFATGYNTTASGLKSFVMGDNSVASGQFSFANGNQNVASGESSIAGGELNAASGRGSIALGYDNDSLGDFSFAFGHQNVVAATAYSATSLGALNTVTFDCAFTTGIQNLASGHSSSAFGRYTVASAHNSTSFGEHTKAESRNCFVVGQGNIGGYSDNGTPGDTSDDGYKRWILTDPVFEIGIGNDINDDDDHDDLGERVNAMTVLKNGNVGIGIHTPGHALEVNGTIRTQEVIVEASNWPDFVFEEDYERPTLTSWKAHIEKEGHLPGFPSKAEAEANGVNVSEIQKALLQKIEEMSLIMLEQNETINILRSEVEQLKNNNSL